MRALEKTIIRDQKARPLDETSGRDYKMRPLDEITRPDHSTRPLDETTIGVTYLDLPGALVAVIVGAVRLGVVA